MKGAKSRSISVVAILAAFVTVMFAGGAVMAEEPMVKGLTVKVEIFSGRPNPSFDLLNPDVINVVKAGLVGLPNASVTAEEERVFSKLGYRGIIVTNHGIEGIPEEVQILGGKVKVFGAEGAADRYFEDATRLERLLLGKAKAKGLLTELLETGLVPDPDGLP